MGITTSITKLKPDDLEFYNNIKAEDITARIVQVIDPTHFIMIIKHNGENKKFLCKGYGYKVNDEKMNNELISKINMYLNNCSQLVKVNTHGTDDNGYLLVEIFCSRLNDTLNNLLKYEKGIDFEMNYDHFKNVL